ncbi:MAG TPA: tRNA (adenosine(37)-N6)-threonylcarbamoyltransferase complex dimerization subunit type 1 TsaB [Ktedonobacterales bacterium]|nr:tRNA (adenosine(37)-N6)-threonylcarbamoyltransferase complex dimerization subunit type 1 TsaB [Ktedonobacterales bacterium]
MLLALDTSASYASVALTQDDAILAELTWRVENRHSSELLPRVQETLRAQRVTPAQLDAIAVALGPGSFNGVRAGVATAKGLALALSIPVAGVPTLDVMAWGARLAPVEVWALLDAGRGEVYAAVYDTAGAATQPETWTPRALTVQPGAEPGGYHILAPEALAAVVRDGATLTGELRPAARAALIGALAGRARLLEPAEPRRGGWLATLAQARLRAGRGETPATLEPIYLRRPAITRSARTDVAALSGAGSAAGEEGERLAL